jgi:cytochrome c-type biogenesis protein CcmF
MKRWLNNVPWGHVLHSFIGQTAVLCALLCAVVGCVWGFAGRTQQHVRQVLERCTYGFAAFMFLANAVMLKALLQHDFSVRYVSMVGSRSTPVLFTIVSLWSSLEGSILFWGAVLGAYLAGFAWVYRTRHPEYMPYALSVCLGVAVFFACVIAAPANPFGAVWPVPQDGPGPNPLLQNHVLMVVHPPMLYLGYVGMTVPFGAAIAALLRGEMSKGWVKVLRVCTLVPWMFLSVGIVLGGWWAYEVLGWGGYWAWDPVENASFLPWLAASAYIHATVVQERKGVLKVWTLGLVLASFMLTILGTFMTRSGVFNSVHSFTQSPIGPVFLVFLACVLVLSVVLLVGRAHLFQDEGRIASMVSREAVFLLNNLVFVCFTFTVLLGTLFPLITEAVRGVKVSVGEPYFNRVAAPVGLMLVFLMGVAPVLPWGASTFKHALRGFWGPVLGGVLAACTAWACGMTHAVSLFTFGLCGFAAVANAVQICAPAWQKAHSSGQSFLRVWWRTLRGERRKYGGYGVHMAVVVMVAGIAGSQGYKHTAEASLKKGESMQVAGYTFTYQNTQAQEQPHRFSVYAQVEVSHEGRVVAQMKPTLNFYMQQREPIGTPHVRTVDGKDLYVSLLSFEKDGTQVGLKVFVIPMVVWIWWALPVWVIGTLLALWPHRKVALERASHALE